MFHLSVPRLVFISVMRDEAKSSSRRQRRTDLDRARISANPLNCSLFVDRSQTGISSSKTSESKWSLADCVVSLCWSMRACARAHDSFLCSWRVRWEKGSLCYSWQSIRPTAREEKDGSNSRSFARACLCASGLSPSLGCSQDDWSIFDLAQLERERKSKQNCHRRSSTLLPYVLEKKRERGFSNRINTTRWERREGEDSLRLRNDAWLLLLLLRCLFLSLLMTEKELIINDNDALIGKEEEEDLTIYSQVTKSVLPFWFFSVPLRVFCFACRMFNNIIISSSSSSPSSSDHINRNDEHQRE